MDASMSSSARGGALGLSATATTTDAAFEGAARPAVSTDLLERLVVAARTRRIHDFFRDFDKLGLKRVLPEQAVRALSACGVVMTKNDIAELTAAYTGLDGYFAYELLEQDLTNTPLNGFLERNPTIAPSATDPFVKFGLPGTIASMPAALMPKAALSPREEADLLQVIELCKYTVRTRGIVLARQIRQYDVTHRGVVTASRFVREMLLCFLDLKLEDALLLSKAYGTADGQVRYMAVHRDVTPESIEPVRSSFVTVNNNQVDNLPSSHVHLEQRGGKRAPSPNSKFSRTMELRAAESEIDDLLAKIIRHVWERRIRVKDIFLDFDKMHLNRVTRPQFVRTVSQLRVVGASVSTIDKLAERYLFSGDQGGNIVAYRRFLEDIENAFTVAGLEKTPLSSVNNTLAFSIVSSPPESALRNEIGADEEALLSVALGNMKMTITRVKAFNLRAGMRDFDPISEGFITMDRFMRVLAIYGLVPELAPERNVIIKRYRGTGMRANAVNYRNFLQDVDL